jgi:hypothetical protein
MLYRRFGRTELQMPVFSCGGMRYQFKWRDRPRWRVPRESQRNVEATIRRAFELGVNHFETARGYGTSEMQLGGVLPNLPRDEIIVQTKIAPTADPREFEKTFKMSLAYLKLDCVDLLSLHGINTPELEEQSMRPGGCLEAARAIQSSGRARHIGFSTHGRPDRVLRLVESGRFDYVNLHWYYIHQVNWPAIEAARRLDMGVFIISPSDKGGRLYRPSERLVELCRPLSPMVFNDLFCLSRPEVGTLSIGAARPGDFDEHLKALELIDRADELLPPIVERLQRAMTDKLGDDWVQTWSEGLPYYKDTPGEVNVPVILWLRNLALAYDMMEYGQARYNLLGRGGHWWPGEQWSKAEGRDLTACLAASPHAEKIPALLAEADRMLAGCPVDRLMDD